MKNVKLNCGIEMPIIGYGIYMAAIRGLDTGHNLEGWPADALKYNPDTV